MLAHVPLYLSPLAGRGRLASKASRSGEGASPRLSTHQPPHPDPLPASGARECVVPVARLPVVLLAILAMSSPAHADIVHLYAAGSLCAALTEVAKAFEAQSGHQVQAKFGPSGILKDEIAGGAKADLFASANMEHPQALSGAKKSGPVLLFARNKLCALVKPGLKVESAGLLDRMLDPAIKLGTSTPKADPSGDYAFEVFLKAQAIKSGAQTALEAKALQLSGGPASAGLPPDRSVYGWYVAEGRADIFLAYCTAAREAKNQNPAQQIVELPDNLTVGADYGLTVVLGASPAAQSLAQFILSAAGQGILVRYGFAPGQK
ncbi:MAG: molybdate ABC transporter substrate-binding protein [Xanthobacteraceae bacterium]|nr:molybdate ABC transporter substrate-binding protein [Xanthobacteraceae bacterium]